MTTFNQFLRGVVWADLHDSHIRRFRIAKLPRVKFVFGRIHWIGPGHYQFGIWWKRDFGAQDGDMVYQRWLILRIHFCARAWLDWSR